MRPTTAALERHQIKMPACAKGGFVSIEKWERIRKAHVERA